MGEHCPDHFVEVSFLRGSSTHHFVDVFFSAPHHFVAIFRAISFYKLLLYKMPEPDVTMVFGTGIVVEYSNSKCI